MSIKHSHRFEFLHEEYSKHTECSNQLDPNRSTGIARWCRIRRKRHTFRGTRLERSIHVCARSWISNLFRKDITEPHTSVERILCSHHLAKVLCDNIYIVGGDSDCEKVKLASGEPITSIIVTYQIRQDGSQTRHWIQNPGSQTLAGSVHS